MARIEKKTKVVETVSSVILYLSLEEAQAVRDVLARVGGSPDDSRRGFTKPVFESLIGAIGPYDESDATGHIVFDDTRNA